MLTTTKAPAKRRVLSQKTKIRNPVPPLKTIQEEPALTELVTPAFQNGLAPQYIHSEEFARLSESKVFQKIPQLETPTSKARAEKTVPFVPGMPTFMSQMCSTKLLSPEQEQLLFRRMNYAKYRIATLMKRSKKFKVSSRHVAKLEWLQESAVQDRNRIVSANLRLVISIAKKYSTHENPFEDLLSEGIASLMYAVEKFNYAKGFRFSTYATYAIKRSLYRYVQQRATDNSRFVAAETNVLENQPQTETTGIISETRWQTLQQSLSTLLAKLEPRERTIIQLRFGLGRKTEVMTLQTLAAELGVCKERVRQLEQRAIAKLRTWAEALELPTSENS